MGLNINESLKRVSSRNGRITTPTNKSIIGVKRSDIFPFCMFSGSYTTAKNKTTGIKKSIFKISKPIVSKIFCFVDFVLFLSFVGFLMKLRISLNKEK